MKRKLFIFATLGRTPTQEQCSHVPQESQQTQMYALLWLHNPIKHCDLVKVPAKIYNTRQLKCATLSKITYITSFVICSGKMGISVQIIKFSPHAHVAKNSTLLVILLFVTGENYAFVSPFRVGAALICHS